MLVLFETAAGYAVFKLLDEKKLKKIDQLYQSFDSVESATSILKLKQFKKFKDTTEALEAAAATIEGKMSKSLKKLLKKLVVEGIHDELAVSEAKLGNVIKEKFNISCVANNNIQELMRCIRSQVEGLISGLPNKEMAAMALGLAHSLSRYKLKFSPDKVDTMIVQAVGLLDDLDKELNNYVMRTREWYGWHFPELGKLITDNLAFVKTVKKMGFKTNASTIDLSDILPEEIEEEVKTQAEISMGSEISDEDISQIQELCDEVLSLTEYRTQLYDYLKNRMAAIAPNLTVLVGELVGARLISHAGSLMNLAKHPASTVQILGAEKALFRALKTKHDTPKYGLIYHAQLIGQSSLKNKGKMSRMLAAKASLAIRVDALGEELNVDIGLNSRAKLEKALKNIEDKSARKSVGSGKAKPKFDKYENKSFIVRHDDTNELTIGTKRKETETPEAQPKKKKIKLDTDQVEVVAKAENIEEVLTSEIKKKKKKKKESIDNNIEDTPKMNVSEVALTSTESEKTPKIKKKKKKSESAELLTPGNDDEPVKKKKKTSENVPTPINETTNVEEKSIKKKKKKQSIDTA